jgi:hypothetical protein
MQHDDTRCTDPETLLLDGGMKVLEGSKGDISINEGLYICVKQTWQSSGGAMVPPAAHRVL